VVLWLLQFHFTDKMHMRYTVCLHIGCLQVSVLVRCGLLINGRWFYEGAGHSGVVGGDGGGTASLNFLHEMIHCGSFYWRFIYSSVCRPPTSSPTSFLGLHPCTEEHDVYQLSKAKLSGDKAQTLLPAAWHFFYLELHCGGPIVSVLGGQSR